MIIEAILAEYAVEAWMAIADYEENEDDYFE